MANGKRTLVRILLVIDITTLQLIPLLIFQSQEKERSTITQLISHYLRKKLCSRDRPLMEVVQENQEEEEEEEETHEVSLAQYREIQCKYKDLQITIYLTAIAIDLKVHSQIITLISFKADLKDSYEILRC